MLLLQRKIKHPGLFDFVILVGFWGLLAVQMQGFSDDPGVGWHIKTGEFVYRNFSVPRVDPFLAGPQREWVADQWLSDLLLYLCYQTGGFQLLYLLLTILFALTFFLILYANCVKTSCGFLGSALAVLLTFKLSQLHFILRPVVFSFFFFAVVFGLMYRVSHELFQSSSEEQVQKIKNNFLSLPVLFILWANMHPSFVLGLIVVFAAAAGTLVDKYIFNESAALSDIAIKRLFLLALTCAAVTLVNPYFWGLHWSIFELGHSSFFMKFHMEWLSPDFKSFEGMLLEVMLAVIGVALLIRSGGPRPVNGFELLVVVFFVHSAFFAVRMLPYCSMVLTPLAARCLYLYGDLPLFSELKIFKRVKRAFCWLEDLENSSARGRIGTFVAISVIGGFYFFGNAMPFYHGPYGPPAKKFPYKAIEFIKSQLNSGESVAVMSPPEWGGFITMFGEGRLRAVIDDRNTLLGEKFYKDYFKYLTPLEDWEGYCRRLGVKRILLKREHLLARFIKKFHLELVAYSDELAVVIKVPEAVGI
ncbi:MAG: hypothetical protein D6719_06985 [Candidatus Dadabacteria bacterium]|nr:MAG: hypothetical protein D6719_06985 [Candidatus Dadabacteria bacterium]